MWEKEWVREHTRKQNGTLICRAHSDTESEEVTEVWIMWVTATSLLKSIPVTHHFIVFEQSIKVRRKSRSCANKKIYEDTHLSIYGLHALSRKCILSFKFNFLKSVSFQVLPKRIHQCMFGLFQHTSWTTTVLKVIMYLLSLTHLCWSCPLVKRCGIVLSDGHPSSFETMERTFSQGWRKVE